VITQWLFKSAYEALATPLTYLVVGRLKRAEGLDAFDAGTNLIRSSWPSGAPDLRGVS
jgi:hypothetical protein